MFKLKCRMIVQENKVVFVIPQDGCRTRNIRDLPLSNIHQQLCWGQRGCPQSRRQLPWGAELRQVTVVKDLDKKCICRKQEKQAQKENHEV